MYQHALVVLFFAFVSFAQTTPPPQSDLPLEPQHHRHDADDELPPPSAATLPGDSPVINIDGLCSGMAAADKPKSTVPVNKNTAVAGGCKSVVTKSEFQKLVEAINPEMPMPAKRQLGESYPHYLLFAEKARELGLDQDPSFAEAMRFASLQILTEKLNRYFEEQASKVSDADIEKYYKEHAVKFERAQFLRIFVPKRPSLSTTASSPSQPSTVESATSKLAESIRARAAAGEDFQQLQREAFNAAGINSESPNVNTGRIAANTIPLDQQKVFALDVGQVSEIIPESSGYYIYKLVSKEILPLAQATRQIRKAIISQRLQDSVALLNKSFKSELNPLYFGAIVETPAQ
ncbi:MAG: peptidyl-prolyl cis-trans isomerase [Acidobacteriaceae bacterium]|nr:peptidyl-prolyl cis-trans isomerase [Acidobacteriaceae bacterium]